MQLKELLDIQLPDDQFVGVELGKLRELRKLLWHIRDEMGNRRGKAKLTDAIELVEKLLVVD